MESWQREARWSAGKRPRRQPRGRTSNVGLALELMSSSHSALASPDSLLALQRAAGNAAVARPVGAGLSVQRHSGIQPEVAAAHTLSAAEQKDLPTRDETNDLLKEQKDLTEEKRTHPDKARLQEINDRLKEIDRKLALRKKGDALSDEEETLRRNGYTSGAEAWFADVHTVSFLGRPGHGAHTPRRQAGKGRDCPQGLTRTRRRVGQGRAQHSARPRTESPLVRARDRPQSQYQPFLLNPNDANASQYESHTQSQAIAEAIHRAFLLVLGKAETDEAFFERVGAGNSVRLWGAFIPSGWAEPSRPTRVKYADAVLNRICHRSPDSRPGGPPTSEGGANTPRARRAPTRGPGASPTDEESGVATNGPSRVGGAQSISAQNRLGCLPRTAGNPLALAPGARSAEVGALCPPPSTGATIRFARGRELVLRLARENPRYVESKIMWSRVT